MAATAGSAATAAALASNAVNKAVVRKTEVFISGAVEGGQGL
ncbi:hypothetical protein [Lysobacter gummosus]